MQRRTVLITGTSSGIGRATALYFHEKGWNVSATMRDLEDKDGLEGLPQVGCWHLDVTARESIAGAVRNTLDRFGSIDVVVNNAGSCLMGPFEAATEEQVRSFFDVNVFGVMNVVREVLPHFRERRAGTIINVASLAGRIGIPFSSFYGASKWAVEGFSEAVSYELARLGIRVRIIEPGAINTNFAKNTVMVRKDDVPEYREGLSGREKTYEKRRQGLSDPREVAQVIFRAATDRKSRLRYLAGHGARRFSLLRRVLPYCVFSALVRRIAG